MKYTSSEASKLLKKLNMEYTAVLLKERESKTFLAATGEDPQSVRPNYDYEGVKAKLKQLSDDIITVKHALNLFNTTHTVPGFDLTVDEMLVFLPQLSERVNTLNEMRFTLPKVRERTYGAGPGATIDYRYVNYDVETAARDYEEAYELLTKAQTALDILNNTETMEISL